MIARCTKRMNEPQHPKRHLEEVVEARTSPCLMRGEIVINSDLYRVADKRLNTIDNVAEQLTGDTRWFTPVQRC